MSQTIMRIEVIIADYIQENQKRPVALVLGPKEYLELCRFMQEQMPKESRVSGGLVGEAYGIPIFLKELPGIDLVVPHAHVHTYVVK